MLVNTIWVDYGWKVLVHILILGSILSVRNLPTILKQFSKIENPIY